MAAVLTLWQLANPKGSTFARKDNLVIDLMSRLSVEIWFKENPKRMNFLCPLMKSH
jgi:hypothetical protein